MYLPVLDFQSHVQWGLWHSTTRTLALLTRQRRNHWLRQRYDLVTMRRIIKILILRVFFEHFLCVKPCFMVLTWPYSRIYIHLPCPDTMVDARCSTTSVWRCWPGFHQSGLIFASHPWHRCRICITTYYLLHFRIWQRHICLHHTYSYL